MFTSLRCACGRAAAGRVSGWPAALAASLLIHTGLALFTAPLGLARQVSLERPLRVDWRRSPAPVDAPELAPRAPSPPVNPPQPARPPLSRDKSVAPVAAAAAEVPAAMLQAVAPTNASAPSAPSPSIASASASSASASSASASSASASSAIIVPASAVPPSAAAVSLTQTPTAVVVDRPPATPGAAPLADLAAFCHQRPAPIYPAVARRRGEQGRVLVAVDIDTRGFVAGAEVATSSGSRWLDSAALAAVRKWRCTAAQQAGQAVVASAMQPFSFVLRDAQR